MRVAKLLVAFAATTLMLAACANQKEPAEKAVAQVESSLAEFRSDAEKYAADELKGVEDSVNKLKSSLEKKDYSSVVIGAPAVAVRGELAQGERRQQESRDGIRHGRGAGRVD